MSWHTDRLKAQRSAGVVVEKPVAKKKASKKKVAKKTTSKKVSE